jgi:glycosyltransferase involved in cell wall biosynthesis
MTDAPLVSVIIPAFNGMRFVGDALESAIGQDYRPIEVLVVDDGSTDRTSEVVARFPEARYARQENRGPGAARNLGIRESAGPIVAFLDQDDVWLPGKLRLQVAALVRDPDLGFTLALTETVLLDGKRPGWITEAQLKDRTGCFFPGALVARRSLFDRLGPFDESLLCSSDADWFFRAKDQGVRFEVVEQVLLRRRIHDSNQSNRVETLHRELLGSVRRSIQRQRERKEPT